MHFLLDQIIAREYTFHNNLTTCFFYLNLERIRSSDETIIKYTDSDFFS